MTTSFDSGTDFRKSLEARIKNRAVQAAEPIERLRRKVAFDRFLARVFCQGQSKFILKGGYAMELRLSTARATKDVDLTCTSKFNDALGNKSHVILEELQRFARKDLGDFFVFEVGGPKVDLTNAPYGGARYPVAAYIDRRKFIGFQLDVGMDVVIEKKTEIVEATDWLEFCGIAAPKVSMITVEQQLAEKLHAYSFPWSDRINMRVKDLIDMVLLLKHRSLKDAFLVHALTQIFSVRGSHSIPLTLGPPPKEWEPIYAALAEECGLPADLNKAFRKVSRTMGPILKECHQSRT